MLTAALAGALGCRNLIVLGSECEGGATSCSAEPEPDAKPDPQLPPDAHELPDPANDACAGSLVDGACPPPPAPLLAHWAFDEGAGLASQEASGLAPAGTLVNFSESAWTQGYAGSALHFDGADDFVEFGEVIPFRTLALWVKPETTHVSTSQTESLLPSDHGPLDQWSNPELAYADDSMDAVAGTLLVGTQAQHWRAFHLAKQLPVGAQILGITTTVDTGNLGLLGYFGVELSWDGGASHTAARYSWGQLIAGSNLRQAGGFDRLWGRSWTSEDFLDANFAVRASFGGIANSMAIDYLAVQVHYVEQTTPRTLLSMGESTRLEFAADGSRKLVLIDWPEARVYVNGELDAPLTDAWNRVVVTASTPNPARALHLGNAESAFLTFPFQGVVDELLLFEAETSPDEVEALDHVRNGALGPLEP